MNFSQALKAANAPVDDRLELTSVALPCGFTPDHFAVFLRAYLRTALPARRVEVRCGLFGDMVGNVERLAEGDPTDFVALPVEWSDLDSRLGLRSLGGWLPESLGDVLRTVESRLARAEGAIRTLARRSVVAVSFPTLPLPPVSFMPLGQAGVFEMKLRELIASTGSRLAEVDRVRLLNPQAIDRISPFDERLDVRSELNFGYPYRNTHASALASLLTRLIASPAPKKGIITDLDDTLWKGLVGEVGPDNVSWNLDGHSQVHGLYQQILRSLAASGILIAVASKNDPARVREAFERKDLVLDADSVFPMEVGWGAKSASVAKILKAWNIGEDSVVFIDDTPLELAEVSAMHPQIECVLFPKADEAGAYALVERLRDLFGRSSISADDKIRLESLRGNAKLESEVASTANPDEFLSSIDAILSVNFAKDPANTRLLELINKTNQFNLNGRRVSEPEWLAHLADPKAFVLSVDYRDKFGPLGTIAVVAGRTVGSTLYIDYWVMSCRSFSRRIEHRCLLLLVEKFGTSEVEIAFGATAKNGPFQNFLETYLGSDQELMQGTLHLSRAWIENSSPRTYQKLEEPANV